MRCAAGKALQVPFGKPGLICSCIVGVYWRQHRLLHPRMQSVTALGRALRCSKNRSIAMQTWPDYNPLQPRRGVALKLWRGGEIPDHGNLQLPSVEQAEENQLSTVLHKQSHIPFWLLKPTHCWFALAATRHQLLFVKSLCTARNLTQREN